ncbi:MAG TPA: hypothetical protein VK708_23225 [Bryobacteraceae bacterium]|nr:hypothetical protein [Bryobacteraceae bacterium]
MKRTHPMKYLSYALAVIGLLLCAMLAGAPLQQPVYVFLYAKVTDQVHLDMTEERLRHILPALEQFRKSHPEAHASATVLFTGAVSKALEERNGKTHIVDFVKDYIGRGVIEPGYDGTDEPTYDVRPTLRLSLQQSVEDRWKARQGIAEQFLAEARDPLTGAPASGSGGLKEMQDVFGKAATIRGLELALETYRPAPKVKRTPIAPGTPLPSAAEFGPRVGVFREAGGDTETLQMLAKYNTSAIMFGVPATNPAQLPGFTGEITHFGRLMAPIPDTAPELYWQDYVLRVSETAPPVRAVKAQEGVEILKSILEKANRTTVQLVQVELGSADDYLKPEFARSASNAALKYAYDHPQEPQLPADVLRSADEVNAAWSKEDALMKWLGDDFFRNNAGSRFTSSGDLAKMAGPSAGFTVTTASLRTQITDAINKLGNDTHPFDYLLVDGHYLSLAEVFQVLTDELAEYHKTGKLPESVKSVKVHGPFRLVTGHGPNEGEITAGDIETLCADIDAPLHEETSIGLPRNSVPPLLKVNGMDLNPAQMLRLMGMALANPAPETKFPVRMIYMLGEVGTILPKSRTLYDVGFVWTVKPAPLAIQ